MKKIALLSYHFWYNYGTCFQSYALQFTVQKLGKKCEYLNFDWRYPIFPTEFLRNHWQYKRPKLSRSIVRRFYWQKLKCDIRNCRLLSSIRYDYIVFQNNRLFDRFLTDYIKESEPVADEELVKIEKKYDKIIVGSDQVWNPEICDLRTLEHFMLDFVNDDFKKSSYASSIGKTDLCDNQIAIFKKYLSCFEAISCREKTGCDMLNSLLEREVYHVLDPTFLLSREEWCGISTKISFKKKDYVLCYILGNKECVIEFSKRIALDKKMNLIIVSANYEIIIKYKKYVMAGVGPREFVKLVDECAYIVTDSFHGTAFAINFNKSFYSFYKQKGDIDTKDNSRIPDLLKEFSLEKRLCFDSDVPFYNPIDFDKVNFVLEEKRNQSMKYIKKILL